MDRHARFPSRDLVPAGASFAAAVAAWASTLALSFLSDDWVLIARLRELGPLAWGGRGGNFLRPLTSATMWVDHALYGLGPRGYHLSSLLLHGVTAACVAGLGVALLGSLGGRRRSLVPVTATAAGVLFAVSPSHAEPVSWLACRGDLLAAALGLGAVLLWTTGRTRSRAWPQAIAVLVFLAALLAKESALALPAVVLLWEALAACGPPGRRVRRALLASAPWWGVVAAYLVLRVALLGRLIGGYGAAAHLGGDPIRLVGNFLRFAGRVVVPWPVTAAAVEGRPVTVLLALVAAGAALFLVPLALRPVLPADDRRDPRMAGFCVGAFLLTLLPVVTLGVSLHTSENERLLYLPSAFATLAAAELLTLAWRRQRGLVVAIGVLTIAGVAALPVVLTPWHAASRATETILADLHALPPGEVALITVPDSIAGAYVFRHGLPEALRLSGVAVEPLVVSYALVADPSDRLHTDRDGDRLTLRADDPRTRFYSPFRDPRDWVVRRDADGVLPARGFLRQTRSLTVAAPTRDGPLLLCPRGDGLAPCDR